MACREQAAALRPHLAELKRARVQIAVIGSGSPRFARAFRDEFLEKGVRVLCDEALDTYRRAGFKRGAVSTFSPRAMLNYARAVAAGFRQGKTQGDTLQQGGVMVIDASGDVRFRFASRVGGDHPPMDEVLAALGEGPQGPP